METMKYIIDVPPADGVTRDKAIRIARNVAAVRAEDDGLEVQSVKTRFARLKDEVDPETGEQSKVWQVIAEVIEKVAEFPFDEEDSDDGDEGGLPDKIDEAVGEEDDEKSEDEGDLKSVLMDVIGTLQDFVDNLGGGEEGLDEPPVDLPEVGGPAGPPVKKVGPPKPPMMASRRSRPARQPRSSQPKTATRYLPKSANVSRKEVIADARVQVIEDPELKGYKLANVKTTDTHYVATFVR